MQGVIGIQIIECNGKLVVVVLMGFCDEVLLIFDGGMLVCMCGLEISCVGCNIQGVILICLFKDEKLQVVECMDVLIDEDEDEVVVVVLVMIDSVLVVVSSEDVVQE